MTQYDDMTDCQNTYRTSLIIVKWVEPQEKKRTLS